VNLGGNQRRWKLVDRKFQFGLALRLLFTAVLFFLAGLAIVFAPSFYLLLTTNNPEAVETAASEFLVLHERIWPAALFCFAGVFALCLTLSNRIAGPIYRINTVLGQLLRDEHPERVTFRKNDWFQPTAELLERLSRKMHHPSGRTGDPDGDGTP
jgi:hypothetical protein